MAEELIELGLLKGPRVLVRDRHQPLMWLVEQLTRLITELPLKADSPAAEGYRVQLEHCRERLCRAVRSDTADAVAEEYFTLCRNYLENAATYLLGREGELNEAIKVLQGVVAELASESGDFRRRLHDSTAALGRLDEIKDIGELKQLLSREVGRLKNALAEKQRQEEEMQQRMSEQIQGLRTKLTKAEAEAAVDALTGVANRRAFDDEIRHWIGRSRAAQRPFCMALIALDDFKRVNDTHGHPAGDLVLRSVAQFFKGSVRASDFVARYGGEEFVVLLENIRLAQAQAKMEELLARLGGSPLRGTAAGREIALSVTASCGLAECGGRESQWDLIMRADGALYEAKRSGKNRVVTTW